jgi:CubicO group peptidase (beta-lactamase class C family)
MLIPSRDVEGYYPPPESKGGWRFIEDKNQVRDLAGMDLEKIDFLLQGQAFHYGGDQWSIVIIRHGYLVREFYTFNIPIPTRFNIWSGTKSFTGTAWGLLLEASRQNELPNEQQVDLDSLAYPFIPEGYPLTDPRKERITIRHLLTMTSGIAGHPAGCVGMPMAMAQGDFEHALGRGPNRHGYWADKLAAEPGTHWEYSDIGMQHLSLAFANIIGVEMGDFMQERVFAPIGIEELSWSLLGGRGFLGPHSNGDSGIYISSRELARFGYLALHNGVWDGQQLLSAWWMDLATKASQAMNPAYGYTWWVNSEGASWPDLPMMAGLPRDAFALKGYNANNCFVIPSLDLVVARVGSGPVGWNEQGLIGGIVDAIIPDEGHDG